MSATRFWRRPPFWLGLVLWVIVGGALVYVVRGRPPAEPLPPALGLAPTFQLVDMHDKPFGSKELRGAPYVADFFFTRCQSVCPVLTARMRVLQERTAELGLPVELVSFSVDPEYDTPERLRAYAATAGVDPQRWDFVTGSLDAMRQVVVDGFGTVMEPVRRTSAPKPGDLVEIAHASRFVVVDGEGQIRGYFTTDDTGLDAIVRLVQALRAEARR